MGLAAEMPLHLARGSHPLPVECGQGVSVPGGLPGASQPPAKMSAAVDVLAEEKPVSVGIKAVAPAQETMDAAGQIGPQAGIPSQLQAGRFVPADGRVAGIVLGQDPVSAGQKTLGTVSDVTEGKTGQLEAVSGWVHIDQFIHFRQVRHVIDPGVRPGVDVQAVRFGNLLAVFQGGAR